MLTISECRLFVFVAPLSLLLFAVVVFGLKERVFSPRRDRWLRLAPQSTPAGPQRSGGVADLCYVAGVDNVNGEGETKSRNLSAGMETAWNEGRVRKAMNSLYDLVFIESGLRHEEMMP